jgi:carbonic anhydrase
MEELMAQIRPGEKQHEVDSLVITCSDHRFQESYEDKFRELKINHYDRIAYPGASKAVASRKLNDAIIALRQLHSFNTIHVMDHTDCGGFGGLEAYGYDENAEAEAHFKSLKKATEAIGVILPKVIVIEHVIGLHGEEIQPGDDPRVAPRR